MSIIKMRGPIDVLFAFKIFSLPVPTRPGTRTFWQVPDPSRPEVKNPYPSDPGYKPANESCVRGCLKSDLLFVLLLLRDTAEATLGFFTYFQGQILTVLEHPSIFKSE